MPWAKQYDEQHVLERAMHAFWSHGYEATSINDLVQATGINRGSLYSVYDGKRALFIEALKRYDRQHRHEFLARLANDNPPEDAIIALFETAAQTSGRNGQPAGCLLVNTALELSPHDPEIKDFITASFARVEAFFFAMIEKSKPRKAVPADLPSRQTAKALLGLFLGLRVLARSGADRATLDTITSQARVMLNR